MVQIGQDFAISSRFFRTEIGAQSQGRLEIGDRVGINQGCSIVAVMSIAIGDDCLIGDMTCSHGQ